MKLKLFEGLNPADGRRRHGARFGFYVFAKATVLILNLVLGVATLVASFADPTVYAWCSKVAGVCLKMLGLAIPYLAAEALYWRYRLRRSSSTGETTSPAS